MIIEISLGRTIVHYTAAMSHMRTLLPLLLCVVPAAGQARQDPSAWTIYVTNDACSDYTWGFDEQKTRRAYADVVRAHLDEMTRTDGEAFENRDRYNLSVAQEADAFFEYYPQRKQEFIRRVKEGRIYIGPKYNNALWGFQSTESMIRTLYPARRMQREWGARLDVAEHMEQPALPWGAASILAASGFRWLSVPYYNFDSTFSALQNPPLFVWEGPDGGRIRVVMDKFASAAANYVQGAYILEKPGRIAGEWLPHYQQLDDYPTPLILASGTHGDNNPTNGNRAAGFADAIIRYNAQSGFHARLINATLPMFFDAVDAAKPTLPALRGDFGHSWDVWPVALARYVAAERAGEHALLSAEALLARSAGTLEDTRAERLKAEWNWIMLADHAWNGTDDENRRVNSELRRQWGEELQRLAGDLTEKGWKAAGLRADTGHVSLFNPLSAPRAGLVRIEAAEGVNGVSWQGRALPAQFVLENGKRMLYFVSPNIGAFDFATVGLERQTTAPEPNTRLRATNTGLENARYRLKVDTAAGGISSLRDKTSGVELLTPGSAYTIGQTVFFSGMEHRLSGVTTEVEATGPVFARLRIHGATEGIDVISRVTIYADLDRIDFDIRIHKPVTKGEQRLTQMFPVAALGAVQHVETMGAVIRPMLQPEGDMLPGGDTRRFAVQGFVDASPTHGPGVTVAPIDAFALRRDLGGIGFEALGNDHDYTEIIHDQGGSTDFRFRYSLRAHAGAYDNAETVAWSRGVSNPLLAALGELPGHASIGLSIDAHRAVATAFKPAEETGRLLRIWETAGRAGPLELGVAGFRKAVLTDLLERPIRPLPIRNGRIAIDLKPNGFAAVQLVP